MKLRNLIKYYKAHYYKTKLSYLGEFVDIDIDTQFINPKKISIGNNSKIFKGVIIKSRTNNNIGINIKSSVKIHEYTYIDDYGGSIFLDDYVGIGHHCVLGGHGGLFIGKYSMISGLTYIVPANHGMKIGPDPYVKQMEVAKGIYIGSNVWIGAGCIILDGVSIGDNAIVGAGSIVTKDIPPNSLAFGNPARIKRILS